MGDSNSMGDGNANIHWTVKLEEYFASTGEKAHCLSWVHKQSEAMYSSRRTWIDLPVIVGSGVIAFLNAGSQSMFEDAKVSSVALGVGSLVVGILNTMGTYFGWAKRAEGHRISSIHYSKLYRFITVELSLPREERMNPHDFLKYVKDQYDRLQEISPMVPQVVIAEFQKKFKNETEISKPEEANGLEKITIYRRADEEEAEAATLGKPLGTPKPPAATMDSKGSFVMSNPLRKSPELKKKDEKAFVPTLKAVTEAAKSSAIPDVPEELNSRPSSVVSLSDIEEAIKMPTLPKGAVKK
jgi:hypothetical protein